MHEPSNVHDIKHVRREATLSEVSAFACHVRELIREAGGYRLCEQVRYPHSCRPADGAVPHEVCDDIQCIGDEEA